MKVERLKFKHVRRIIIFGGISDGTVDVKCIFVVFFINVVDSFAVSDMHNMHFMFNCVSLSSPSKFTIYIITAVLCYRLPLYKVEHHPAVELWIDRFERTKGELIIMKADEFRNRSVNQIASVWIFNIWNSSLSQDWLFIIVSSIYK